MSLLPYLFPDVSNIRRRYRREPFGLDFLTPEYFCVPGMSHPVHVSEFYRPPVRHNPGHNDTHNNTSKKFQVCLDVHQFAPNEIKVKTVGRYIYIEAKHEEMEDDHGYVSRHFVRKYPIPEGHEPNEVTSTLSSDGILTINAPRDPIILPDKNERIVPISRTGPVNDSHSSRELSVEHEKDVHHHKKDIHNGTKKQENEVPLAIKYNV